MPVIPNAVERLLWLRLNRAPAPFLDLFSAGGFRAGTVALELGVFRALSHGPRTPADLARELDLDERGLAVLLRFLDPLGYVSRSGAEYEVTPMTRSWLAPGDRTDIGPWLRFWDELVFPTGMPTSPTSFARANPPGPSTSGSTTSPNAGRRPSEDFWRWRD